MQNNIVDQEPAIADELDLTPVVPMEQSDPTSTVPVNTFNSSSSAGVSSTELKPIEEIFGGPRVPVDDTLAQWEDVILVHTEVYMPPSPPTAEQPLLFQAEASERCNVDLTVDGSEASDNPSKQQSTASTFIALTSATESIRRLGKSRNTNSVCRYGTLRIGSNRVPHRTTVLQRSSSIRRIHTLEGRHGPRI